MIRIITTWGKIQVVVQSKMSAPMSSDLELIPNQHIRQELCVTRPAYRDGRDPKAVKVNNWLQNVLFALKHE